MAHTDLGVRREGAVRKSVFLKKQQNPELVRAQGFVGGNSETNRLY
jgi:hypothetical protein